MEGQVEFRGLQVMFCLNILDVGIHFHEFGFVLDLLQETDLKEETKDCSNKYVEEKEGACAFPHWALEVETQDNKLEGTYSL